MRIFVILADAIGKLMNRWISSNHRLVGAVSKAIINRRKKVGHVTRLGAFNSPAQLSKSLGPSCGHLTSNKGALPEMGTPVSRPSTKITKVPRFAILLGYRVRGFTPGGVPTVMSGIAMGGN